MTDTSDRTFPIIVITKKYIGVTWDQERIIWIAFHQNINNKQCLISQLPKDVVFSILLFLRPPALLPQATMYEITVPQTGIILDLKREVSKLTSIPMNTLSIADVWHNRVYRFYKDDEECFKIRLTDITFAYEMESKQKLLDNVFDLSTASAVENCETKLMDNIDNNIDTIDTTGEDLESSIGSINSNTNTKTSTGNVKVMINQIVAVDEKEEERGKELKWLKCSMIHKQLYSVKENDQFHTYSSWTEPNSIISNEIGVPIAIELPLEKKIDCQRLNDYLSNLISPYFNKTQFDQFKLSDVDIESKKIKKQTIAETRKQQEKEKENEKKNKHGKEKEVSLNLMQYRSQFEYKLVDENENNEEDDNKLNEDLPFCLTILNNHGIACAVCGLLTDCVGCNLTSFQSIMIPDNTWEAINIGIEWKENAFNCFQHGLFQTEESES